MRILFCLNLILAVGLAQEPTVIASAPGPNNSTFEVGVIAAENSYSPFIRKRDAEGQLVFYRAFDIRSASASAIALTSKGEPIIAGRVVLESGQTFPTTPGAYSANQAGNTGFIIKLDPTGQSVLYASRGFGAGILALDAADNIYIAGTTFGPNAFTPSPGAFQSQFTPQPCGGSTLGIPCQYQYIAKLNAEGTRLMYATYVTGSHGANPFALWIDTDGNALFAGRTNSEDYPTTQGALQPDYRARKRAPAIGFRPPTIPPAASGYITKLNATGTALIWSTYFSGSGADTLTGFRLGEGETLILSGFSTSKDLPAAQAISAACTFSYNPQVPFLSKISNNGAKVLLTRYLYEIPEKLPTSIDPAVANPYLCATDSADNAFLYSATPNQLLSIHSEALDDGPLTINGEPAAVLFRSASQINLRVPAGSTPLNIQIGHQYRPLSGPPPQPSAFLDLASNHPFPGTNVCGGSYFGGVPPIARNEDGSLNSCSNPAQKRSVVTLYLNGFKEQPTLVSIGDAGEVLAMEPDPDSPQGVWRLQIRLSDKFSTGAITPVLDGRYLRFPSLAVFTTR